MSDPIPHARLKAKEHKLFGDAFPDVMELRVHRAISWIGRAEKENKDEDARFIFLWIAFNAAYADEEKLQRRNSVNTHRERSTMDDFFEKVIKLDVKCRIYNAIWKSFSGPIRTLIHNKYIFEPFWKHHNHIEGYDDWECRLDKSIAKFNQLLKSRNTPTMLSIVFDRLYVLRNQLIHGGATWNSGVNREQIRDGARIMAFLMPLFVDVMMDNPDEGWGQPFYPVVD